MAAEMATEAAEMATKRSGEKARKLKCEKRIVFNMYTGNVHGHVEPSTTWTRRRRELHSNYMQVLQAEEVFEADAYSHGGTGHRGEVLIGKVPLVPPQGPPPPLLTKLPFPAIC